MGMLFGLQTGKHMHSLKAIPLDSFTHAFLRTLRTVLPAASYFELVLQKKRCAFDYQAC